MDVSKTSHLSERSVHRLFERLIKNASFLLAGNTVALLLGLASTALTARALGVQAFGLLALIRSYVMTIDWLVNFQSWQAMIRYGADVLARGDTAALKRLLTFGFLLDVSMAILGALIAVLGAGLVGRWQGWDPKTIELTGLCSLSIACNLTGMPKAVLRLFNRFDRFAWQQVLLGVIKLVGVALAFAGGAGLRVFVLVWMATDMLGYVLLFVMAWWELRQQGLDGVLTLTSVRGVAAAHPGLWQFVWTTKISGSIRTALKELDTLTVGGLLGASAAGLYQVTKQCTKVIDQFVDPLGQALYPELSILWARRDRRAMREMVFRSVLLAGGVAALAWVFGCLLGRPLLRLLFGPEFVAAYPILVWYLLGIAMMAVWSPVESAVLAAGRPDLILRLNVGVIALFFASLVTLSRAIGLPGTGLANVVQHLAMAIALCSVLRQIFRQSAEGPVAPQTVVTRTTSWESTL